MVAERLQNCARENPSQLQKSRLANTVKTILIKGAVAVDLSSKAPLGDIAWVESTLEFDR